MTLQQLVYFTAVYRHGSFTNAANELYISQSSLSKQIISLEKELGAELFVRTTRNIHLSEIGERLLPHASRMVEEYVEIMRCAEQAQQNKKCLIQLGGVPVLSIYGITEAILQFETLHPELHVEVMETKSVDILNRLSAHTLDIGIMRLSLPLEWDSNSLLVIPLVDDQQVLVTPSDHPLAKRDRIFLSEAAGDVFVQLNSDPLVAAYHVHQVESQLPDTSLHLSKMKMDSIKQCILQKGWVSLMMEQVAQAIFLPETHIIPLEDPLRLTLCAVLRREEPRAACQALVRFLTARFVGKTSFDQHF